MVEISKYQGLRQNVFQSYLQQYELHSKCLALISDITDLFTDGESRDPWHWKMRSEWHERMRYSIETYLLKRYRAQNSFLQDFVAGVNIRVHTENIIEDDVKGQLQTRIGLIRELINGLLNHETLPRQVDDMMSDHQSVLSTLYDE